MLKPLASTLSVFFPVLHMRFLASSGCARCGWYPATSSSSTIHGRARVQCSEIDACPQLYGSVAENTCYLAKERIGDVGDNAAKLVTVESIQELCPQLESHVLANLMDFLKTEVLIDGSKIACLRIAWSSGSQS